MAMYHQNGKGVKVYFDLIAIFLGIPLTGRRLRVNWTVSPDYGHKVLPIKRRIIPLKHISNLTSAPKDSRPMANRG